MADHTEELRDQRLTKLERLRTKGIDPYPARVPRRVPITAALENFEGGQAHPERTEQAPVAVAGRITAMRMMGRAAFVDLRDGTGRIQVHCRRDVLQERYELLRDLDLGDFLSVEGTLFLTKTGEVTVAADQILPIAKALRPPPEKWHGLQDVEQRYRRRYLDLMANEEARELARTRSRFVRSIRSFMDGRDFIEVETPVLQASAGGAAARPFITYFNALDEQHYLRVATELHLKRLIIGGLDRVYEIGRIFRNEGIDTKHNPEFTTMESYEAYADYHAVAQMVEDLVCTMAQEVIGTLRLPRGETVIDLAPPWRRTSYRHELVHYAGFDLLDYLELQRLQGKMAELRIPVPPGASWGKCIDEVFSTLVEPHLVQPTFVLDYPRALSPLAKAKLDQPELVERFEAFMGGFEIANAYSELNDPIDQRERFNEQLRQRAAGDEETELLDEDFLLALEHGMPPTGGLGVGIDRLLMVLMNQTSIREVILFPQLRSLDA
ncbi:MAG: lysine--tRNA ligase [Dehalococcoidia bacterium]